MNESDVAFALLKADLGFMTPSESTAEYMKALLSTARKAIAAKGVTLDETDIEDSQLVSMYAAWLYRKRDSGTGVPDMLRYALNNRIVREGIQHDI